MSDSTNMFFGFFFFQSSLRLQPALFTLLFFLSFSPFFFLQFEKEIDKGEREESKIESK